MMTTVTGAAIVGITRISTGMGVTATDPLGYEKAALKKAHFFDPACAGLFHIFTQHFFHHHCR